MFTREHTRESERRKSRRLGSSQLLGGLAFGVVGVLFASSAASAAGLDSYPEDPTEAEASIAELNLGGEDLIALGHSNKGSLTNPGTEQKPLAGSILGGEIVDFGGGISLPLDQFIDFGQAGVLLSESTATDGKNGEAISGIAGADGGLTLDGADGDFGTAQVDLLSLFSAAGVDGLTDVAIDQADFSFGLGGAWVEAIDGEFQDPDGVGGAGQYRVADAKIIVHSPVIEAAADGISDAAGTLEDNVIGTVNDVLDLGTLIPGFTVDASIETTLQEDVLDGVLLAPIETDDGLVSIDIGAGTITIDAGRIGGNDDGVIPDRPVGLNNQNPNTELIDSTIYPFIASSVHDVLEKVIDVAVESATESLNAVNIGLDISAPGITAGADLNLAGDVSNYTCDGGFLGAIACAPLDLAVPALGAVIAPAFDLITDPNSPLSPYSIFTTVKTDLITVPIRAVVDPFLDIIAAAAFSVQLNHQEVQTCTPPGGTETTSALSVSALSIGVVGGLARFGVGNAGVRVDACALAAPALTATSPVPAGGSSTVTSGGWAPNTDITLQLTDPDGAPVGDPVDVTTDGDGNIPADTQVPVPADADAGDYTIVGSNPDGDEVTADLAVYAPTLEAQSPVAPGDCSAITSSGWLPNTDITLQLRDADGDPVGDPLVVTTDGDGNIPADTCVLVPADAPAGEYEIIGTDDNGAEITVPVTVDAAPITPTLTAESPVPAGGETVIESGSWNPDSEISIQLTDGAGDPVGDPVVVTTDGDGNVPAGTTVPIPADAPAGDYTVVGTDPDGNTISAPLAIYAPVLTAASPVPAGGTTAVTSSGWLPNASVSLQLTDGTGAPVGDPVVVTADGDGVLPAGTTVPVPAGTTPGVDYSVVATDGTAEIAVTLEITADGINPTIEVTSPVAAGGETTVISGPWNPTSEVTLVLTDGAGDPVGDPVVVTTDGDGNVPAGTVVPVPLTAPIGTDYTVVATDEDGVEVSASLEVTAPVLDVTLTASTPVPAGGQSTVQSTGWVPDSEVTLVLTDAAGDPVGDPVVVTADSTGAVPAGTVVAVPADADAGDYTVTATDGFGNDASAPVAVYAPSITTTSPVTAGDTTTVTSTGWLPNSAVTLQLTDGAGDPVGAAVDVTTDGAGAVPAATTVTVPSDTPEGTDYSVVATDANGAEVAADLEVVGVSAGTPVLTATSPVSAGGESTVDGSGWEPATEVTLVLTDSDGNPVGDPIVVTTDGDGNIPDGTTIPIPADAPAGSYTVEGSDGDGNEASAPLAIYVPTIAATSPVTAGDATTVTSSGWLANSAVALQLTDGAGDPVGAAVNVTTDATGTIPAATTVPVPADAVAGSYSVIGSDENGAEVSATVEVLAAGAGVVLTATSPVPAGGTSTVTSSGWEPAASVSLQLTDGDGNPVGDPIVVTTDGDGNIPAGTTVTVAADATAGTYSIVGTDSDGNEASAPVSVYAPQLQAASPVPAGSSSQITSDGWVPNSEVTLQLIDGDGNAVGDPVVVNSDGSGALPAGTAVLVPASAAPGEYSLIATDDNGAAVEAALTVAAATDVCSNPQITIDPTTVAAGSIVTVTGSGFAAGGTATVQLHDAGGKALLDSALTVTVGADCGFTVWVKIPADLAPGDYTIDATDDAGNAATADVTITRGSGSGLATTGGEPGVYVPLAIILIALGAAAFVIRRRGVVTDQL